MASPHIYFTSREDLIAAFRLWNANSSTTDGGDFADRKPGPPEALADALISYLHENEHPYTVGPPTMAHVFTVAGITNLSDMQAVLDAVEAALERLCFGEEAKGLHAAAAEGGAS